MILRPTLTTTTDPALLAQVQAIQTTEKRTRASVVQELLTLGLRARSKRRDLARVRRGVHAKSIQGARS